MNKKRLLILAKYLETKVPAKRFDLNDWIVKPFAPDALKRNFDCQTAACAVGYATTIPSFQKAGFYIDAQFKWPAFEHYTSWDAVQKFFGLSCEESRFLFSKIEYVHAKVGPVVVAYRIRQFVETGKAQP